MVQAHGFLERTSDDIDLFTDVTGFAEAGDRVAAAYRTEGFTVDVEFLGDVFARFTVIDETGREAKVEMRRDWRSRPLAHLGIGLVLHPDEAVANKMTTLCGRAAPCDYLDVDDTLASGRYTPERLLETRRSTRCWFRTTLFRAGSPGSRSLAGPRIRGVRSERGTDRSHA
ncbi:hypothetical protein [Embleya sp. NPDC020886]|uniref:hypothetical protein n=1 Tax=Embleya sp. NPDC020886 TaxID=3363980 RepID=UPI00379EE51F